MDKLAVNQNDPLHEILSIANSFTTHASPDNDNVCPSDANGGNNVLHHHHSEQQDIRNMKNRLPTPRADDQVVSPNAAGYSVNGPYRLYTVLHNNNIEGWQPTLQADKGGVVRLADHGSGGVVFHQTNTDPWNTHKVETRIPELRPFLYQERSGHHLAITPGNDINGMQRVDQRTLQGVPCEPSMVENQRTHPVSYPTYITLGPLRDDFESLRPHGPILDLASSHPGYSKSVDSTPSYSFILTNNPVPHTQEPRRDLMGNWTSNDSFQNRMDYHAGFGRVLTPQNMDNAQNISVGVSGIPNFGTNSLVLPLPKKRPDTENSLQNPSIPKLFKKEEHENNLLKTLHTPDEDTKLEKNGPRQMLYECSECHLRISNHTGLNHHMRIHRNGDCEKWIIICAICREVASNLQKLDKHLEQQHQIPTFRRRVLAPKAKRNENGRYECPKCNKVFRKHENHKEHLRIHTGEMPFECSFCKKKYRAQGAYALHVKSHNTKKQVCTPIVSNS
ncbi:uncharacterized protein [Procambarus clarkii]|uniref:uncharacterized protein n=1 Tax=Procambarus clarkii TaxID=6728 RepID=UPI0037428641